MADEPGQTGIPSQPTPGGNAAAMMTPPANPAAPAAPAPPPAPPAPGAPPAPPPAPAPTGVITPWKDGEVYKIGEGATAQEWWKTIPEQAARDTIEAKQYKNPNELALAYHNLTKLQRGADDVIGVPGKDATPEQKTAFDAQLRQKLGVPEKPDGYVLDLGPKPDPKFVEFGKNSLHEMGVPPEKAQNFVNKWNAFVEQQTADKLAKDTAENDAAITALETKLGAGYEAAMAAGRRAMEGLGLSAELVEKIEGKVGTAPLVELLVTLGMKTGEASWAGGGGGQQPTDVPEQMNPAQANAKIAAMQGDAAFMTKYNTKTDPGHGDAVKFMERLHQAAAKKPA